MSKKKQVNFAEYLDKVDKEQDELNQQLFGNGLGNFAGRKTTQQDTLANSKNYHSIIAILHEDPILVGPCFIWLQEKRKTMAEAKLIALHGREKYDAMVAKETERMKKETGKS